MSCGGWRGGCYELQRYRSKLGLPKVATRPQAQHHTNDDSIIMTRGGNKNAVA
jgi:hypothetical protein